MSLDVKADVHASVLGYTVSDLQSDIAVVSNEITGTLAYVTDFTGFSGDPELQKGNFLALSFDSDPAADKMTVELMGAQVSPGEIELDSDKDCVFRITDKDAQSVVFRAYKGGEVTRRTYKLSGLVLEPAE